MDNPKKRRAQTGKIQEDEIHAEDIDRRAFAKIGMFAATGLAGLAMGCGSDARANDSSDTGDSVDADPTDPADTDVGDSSDPFDFDPTDPADTD